MSVVETIIITLHLETDWPKLPVPTNKNFQSCSPYMRELSQFITRVYQTYLASFENKEVLFAKYVKVSVFIRKNDNFWFSCFDIKIKLIAR